jgi:hypothetical protein
MLYGGQSLVYIFELKGINIFVLKLVAFLLLQPSFFFEFRLFHTSFPSRGTTSLTLAFYTVVCCPPMPPRRESLARVKTRLARGQKIRTDRRVAELLHPRERGSDIEVFDDSEEDDRIASRRARGLGVQANLRQLPSISSFCGVFLVVALL